MFTLRIIEETRENENASVCIYLLATLLKVFNK